MRGDSPAKVEAAIDEEIARLIAEGPTAAEVGQARAVSLAAFVRGVERIGGFGGKADVLAECQVFTGNASCYRATLANIQGATAAQLKDVARRWLARGAFTLQIDPGDRKPVVEEPAVGRRRRWSRRALSLVRRHHPVRDPRDPRSSEPASGV